MKFINQVKTIILKTWTIIVLSFIGLANANAAFTEIPLSDINNFDNASYDAATKTLTVSDYWGRGSMFNLNIDVTNYTRLVVEFEKASLLPDVWFQLLVIVDGDFVDNTEVDRENGIVYVDLIGKTILTEIHLKLDQPGSSIVLKQMYLTGSLADATPGVEINGVVWATRNVGAPGTFVDNPENYGMYYQWGSNVGWISYYPPLSTSGDTEWKNYYETGNTWTIAKDPCPAGWRVPTIEEFESLLNSDSEFLRLNDVAGRNFGSENNIVFLPQAGLHYYGQGQSGNYWSSSNSNKYDVSAQCVSFSRQDFRTTDFERETGQSIRCVKDNPIPVNGISLDIYTIRLAKGSGKTLTATILPTNATNKTIIWSSSNDTIATIDVNGKITAINTGRAIITAEADGKTANCEVEVFEAIFTPTTDPGIEINGVVWATRNVDAPGTFATNPEDAGMFYQWNRNIGWSVTDPMINSNGNTEWNTAVPEGTEWEAANDPSPAGWRVPSFEDVQKLRDRDKVSSQWTTQDGTVGQKFTDIATGNSVFFPVPAGWRHVDGTIRYPGAGGAYWTSTPDYGNDDELHAHYFGFGSVSAFFTARRSTGYSVRSVAKPVKDNVTWNFENGTLTISGTGKMTDYKNTDEAPWYNIRSSISKIIIEDGITHIADYAFYDSQNLTEVSIPRSVTSIGLYAFLNCKSLRDIIIPNDYTVIKQLAFSQTAWLDEQPDGLVYIGKTLYGIKGVPLVDVVISDGTIVIADYAFAGWSSIASITIPSSVAIVGEGFFATCSGLRKVIVSWEDKLPAFRVNPYLSIPANCILVVPTGTKELYRQAEGWKEFTIEEPGGILIWEIGSPVAAAVIATLENNTLTISGTGKMADFISGMPWNSYKTSITKVVIEDGVTTIGGYAFGNCSDLKSVSIPSSITIIGTDAFFGCTGLTSVTIPNGVTIIDYEAFRGCTGLESVSISESVREIGVGAFFACTGLTSIIIPDGVQYIGMGAFTNCINLVSVTIPESVKVIGGGAFYNCSRLDSVTVKHVTPINIFDDTFFGVQTTCTLKVPYASVDLYKNADVWKNFNVVSIDNNHLSGQCGDDLYWSYDTITRELTITGTGAMYNYYWDNCEDNCAPPWFNYQNKITLISLPVGITHIGNYAFDGCLGLTSITIPNSVISIGNSAFFNCSGLTSVTIPNSVTSIDDNVFEGCTGLTSVINLQLTPQAINTNVFSTETYNNATLYVPAESLVLYQNTDVWKDFYIVAFLEILEKDIIITPSDSSALIVWQSIENAEGYRLLIYADAARTDLIFTLEFNGAGQLVDIVAHRTRSVMQTSSTNLSYEIKNLLSGTDYYYTLEVLGTNNVVLTSISNKFTTTGDPTNIVETQCIASLPNIIGYYSLIGQKLKQEPTKGIYIILYDNGKTEKVMK